MKCFVYLPHSYNGRGPAGSCVQIIRHFKAAGLEVHLFVGREKKLVPSSVYVWRAIPRFLNWLPWRLISNFAHSRVHKEFARRILKEEPGIAYFWPTPDPSLVDLAKRHGWLTIREMTNRTLQAAKVSLDKAFAIAEETRPHHIDDMRLAEELAILNRYDFVFSSNDEVDKSLNIAGLAAERILNTSFGWAEERFGKDRPADRQPGYLTVGYLGTISIGKGVLDLLDAWLGWDGQGRLRLAGPIDWSMEDAVRSASESDPRIERVGYVEDVEEFFQSCDVVVIPTLDEGGPQVTYEAAAAGAAIVATPMASARMLEHEKNCLLVPTHDSEAIRRCFNLLVANRELGMRLGDQARQDSKRFAYAKVGAQRAGMLLREAAQHVTCNMPANKK